MQPVIQDQHQAGRRSLDIEDYIDVVRRHKAWILGPAFLGLVIATVVAFSWPNSYISESTIKVVPPQIPPKYIDTNINIAMSQRVNSMAQNILGRSNLITLINSLDLYPRERKTMPVEDVAEMMRYRVWISGVNSMGGNALGGAPVSAFKISFKYDKQDKAQAVVSKLATRFTDENTRERTRESQGTTAFVREMWDAKRKEMEALERKLTDYRQQFAGRLPEQVGQNVNQLNMYQARIDSNNGSLGRLEQNKLLLEAQLLNAQEARKAIATPSDEVVQETQRNEKLAQKNAQVEQAEGALWSLRERYTDAHPDVKVWQKRLDIFKRERDAAAQEKPKEKTTVIKPNRGNYQQSVAMYDGEIKKLNAALQANALEAVGVQKDIASTNERIRALQSKIEGAPSSEQQYTELMRDRDFARAEYATLTTRYEESQRATQGESRSLGERLEILDGASYPSTPSDPKRPFILGCGFGVGLVIGLVLAGGREVKDTSLKNLKDVRAYTGLNILGSIPLLENDLVLRRRRRLEWLAWSTACLVGIAIMSGSVYYYYYMLTKV